MLPPLAVCAALVCPGPSAGQARDSVCTVQGCELHLTGGLPALFLQPQVERGVEGEELGRMDRSDLFENLFSTHDSADAYYRDFATHDRRGDWSLLLSMVVAVAGIGLDLDVVWDDDLVAAAVGFLALAV